MYTWPKSTYIAEPPFFDGFTMQPKHAEIGVDGARALGIFGDSITTDHIQPGGFDQGHVAGRQIADRATR